MDFERLIIVKDKTRLEKLIEKFNTKSQARFYIERNGGNFEAYVSEHDTYYNSLLTVQKECGKILNTTQVDKSFLPSFIFSPTDLVLVVGRDGLVANTGKYALGNPIIAINPDQQRNFGTLLPFVPENFEHGVQEVLRKNYRHEKITLAAAKLNDGQSMLAFNDFYIGKSNHTSSMYSIRYQDQKEVQSSSGVLVSTGAGSTGWLSSVINEYRGIGRYMGFEYEASSTQLSREAESLFYIVREPFKTPYTQTEMVIGNIDKGFKLSIESQMPEQGIIFSDGIIDDFMEFNSGRIVEIGIAEEKVLLVRN